MAIRVLPRVDPRLVVVLDPTTEQTQQELVNDIMEWEDFPSNLTYNRVIRPSGKQILPDGVTRVAITNTLLNAKIAFEPRTTSRSSGSVTTGDSEGSVLTDSGATFISDGVMPGATVINLTDGSAATVLGVVSETQLLMLFPLEDGSDNQFEVGDSYKVWNTVVCELSGGNLVSVDEDGDPISAVFPTAFVEVIRTSSSSATLQELQNIQHASFNCGVTVDVINGVPGTEYPKGTGMLPVNNLSDARIIAEERGFSKLFIIGNITLKSGDNVDGFSVIGENPQKTLITLEAGLSTEGCEFEQCSIQGILDGDTWIFESVIKNLTYIQGQIKDSTLTGIIVLAGTGVVRLINCSDGVPGINSLPLVDMGGSGRDLIVSDYDGTLVVGNLSGAQTVEISIGRGHLHLLDTVTAGTFVLNGIATLDDESTGTTFYKDGLLPYAIWEELSADHVSAGTLGGDLQSSLRELLGLTGKNKYVDNTVHDSDHMMTSARVRIFDTEANASLATDGGSETQGLLKTYTVTTVWEEVNEVKTIRQTGD